MKGRVFGIKKSIILRTSTIICSVACLFFILFSIFYIKNYNLWFFIFSFFVGVVELTKSWLFRSDSACYLGLTLTLLGVAGFCAHFFELDFKYFYFMSAFGASSLLTFLFTHQKFQFFTGILLSASAAIAFLYSNKIINLAIFLAIYLSFLFIFSFVCAILLLRYFKSNKEDGNV